jgi:hypothetical protein
MDGIWRRELLELDGTPLPQTTDDGQRSFAERHEYLKENLYSPSFSHGSNSQPDFVLYDVHEPSTLKDNLTALPGSLPLPQTGDKDKVDATMDQGPGDHGDRLPYHHALYKAHIQDNGGSEVLRKGTGNDRRYPDNLDLWLGGELSYLDPELAGMPMANAVAIPDRVCARKAVAR